MQIAISPPQIRFTAETPEETAFLVEIAIIFRQAYAYNNTNQYQHVLTLLRTPHDSISRPSN